MVRTQAQLLPLTYYHYHHYTLLLLLPPLPLTYLVFDDNGGAGGARRQRVERGVAREEQPGGDGRHRRVAGVLERRDAGARGRAGGPCAGRELH